MVKAFALLVVGAAAADFDAYMNKFGKAYNGDDEYATRKAIYEENMKFIEAENAKGNSYTLGETQFTDLTNEEFKAKYVSGYKSPSEQLGSDLPYLGEHEFTEPNGAVDWTTKGAVTPVKNQGQCGSCWSFSTTGGLEGAWQINAGQLISMSEQQFVDCDKSSMGCNGGSMATAFSWAKSQNIATEASYPYKAVDGTCKSSFSTAIPQGGVTGYKSVGGLFSKPTVEKLESAIDQGPVSIAIEADQASFQHYTGGVLDSGCGTNLDHGVLAVGYDSNAGYWKVKNSWGTSWGDAGYIKLSQSGNVCGILNQPVYPTVSSSVSV
jgi:cathepsin L